MTRRALLLGAAAAAAALAVACSHPAPPLVPSAPAAEQLVGTWKVALRPTPDAPVTYTQFEVTRVTGTTFEGRFYGAPIRSARLNRDWGTLVLSFVSEDASGPYLHAARLDGNTLSGQTNSTGRGFLMVWTATREP